MNRIKECPECCKSHSEFCASLKGLDDIATIAGGERGFGGTCETDYTRSGDGHCGQRCENVDDSCGYTCEKERCCRDYKRAKCKTDFHPHS